MTTCGEPSGTRYSHTWDSEVCSFFLALTVALFHLYGVFVFPLGTHVKLGFVKERAVVDVFFIEEFFVYGVFFLLFYLFFVTSIKFDIKFIPRS